MTLDSKWPEKPESGPGAGPSARPPSLQEGVVRVCPSLALQSAGLHFSVPGCLPTYAPSQYPLPTLCNALWPPA